MSFMFLCYNSPPSIKVLQLQIPQSYNKPSKVHCYHHRCHIRVKTHSGRGSSFSGSAGLSYLYTSHSRRRSVSPPGHSLQTPADISPVYSLLSRPAERGKKDPAVIFMFYLKPTTLFQHLHPFWFNLFLFSLCWFQLQVNLKTWRTVL